MNHQKTYTKYRFTAAQIPILEQIFNKKFDDIIKELDAASWDDCTKKLQLVNCALRIKNYG